MKVSILVLIVAIMVGCVGRDGASPEVPPPDEFENEPAGRPQSSQTDERVFATALASLASGLLPSDSSNRPMLVVADETLDTCPGPRGSGCLQPGDFVLYFKRHPEWGRNAESTFWAQIRVQPVPGSLRNERVDVIFMPAAPAGEAPAPLSDLVRALAPYPNGSVAVQLSSPIYPSHSTAVMSFVSNDGGGVLFLVRENRDWRIVASEGWTY